MKIWDRDRLLRVIVAIGVVNFFSFALAGRFEDAALRRAHFYSVAATHSLMVLTSLVFQRRRRRVREATATGVTNPAGPYRTQVLLQTAPRYGTTTLVLTRLEHGALEKLLEGEHAVLTTLRKQLDAVVVATRHESDYELTVELHVPDEVEAVEGKPDLCIDDVFANIAGCAEKPRFTLTVRNGRLDRLIASTSTKTWPRNADALFFEFAETRGESAGVHQRWIVKL